MVDAKYRHCYIWRLSLQTCRRMRDAIAHRQHWLRRLRGLPRACAPSLPPHVSVETLTTGMVRALVLNAVRVYRHNRFGDETKIPTVSSSYPYVIPVDLTPDLAVRGEALWNDAYSGSIQVVPGGRFLLAMVEGQDHRDNERAAVQLHDISRHAGARIVWTHTLALPAHGVGRSVSRCCMDSDGSILVFIEHAQQ